MDHLIFHAFSCTVNTSARDRLVKEGHVIRDPISLCWQFCYRAYSDWNLERRGGQSYLFFDRDEPFFKEFKDTWRSRRTEPGKLSITAESMPWDLIADIQEVDMELNPPIQGADIIAWSKSRHLIPQRRGGIMEEILKRHIPIRRATLTEEKMRANIDKLA